MQRQNPADRPCPLPDLPRTRHPWSPGQRLRALHFDHPTWPLPQPLPRRLGTRMLLWRVAFSDLPHDVSNVTVARSATIAQTPGSRTCRSELGETYGSLQHRFYFFVARSHHTLAPKSAAAESAATTATPNRPPPNPLDFMLPQPRLLSALDDQPPPQNRQIRRSAHSCR